jgi:hypothetical protein
MPAHLIQFFEDVEQLADYTALDHKQRIKCTIQYTPIDEAEAWVLKPEAKGKDWDKFIAVVKAMYPGCDGNRRYTRTNLENLCAEQVCIPMCSKEELRQYYHKFNKISKHLINMKKLTDLEQGCFFFEGIHSTTSASIKQCLEIKLADHHPNNPYSMSEVYDATVFLLPSIVATVVPTQPASVVAVKTQQPTIQQPGAGTVVKTEYSQMQFSGCYFCRGSHITRNCAMHDKYARDRKITITDTNKISMPNGRGIPGRQEEGNFKQHIDNFLHNGPTTGTNAMILGNMYCRAEPTTQVVLAIEPCAFMHTCADTLEDDSDNEELT